MSANLHSYQLESLFLEAGSRCIYSSNFTQLFQQAATFLFKKVDLFLLKFPFHCYHCP